MEFVRNIFIPDREVNIILLENLQPTYFAICAFVYNLFNVGVLYTVLDCARDIFSCVCYRVTGKYDWVGYN